MSVNKAIILGRLGVDPELKYTPGGAAVCTLSIATSESWMDKSGQKQEKTEWHRVVVWGKQAENCAQYLKKGRQAYIEGRIQTRSWDDQNGQKKYTTEINASTVQFIGERSNNTGSPSGDYGHPGMGPEMYGASNGNGKNASSSEAPMSIDTSYTADDIPF